MTRFSHTIAERIVADGMSKQCGSCSSNSSSSCSRQMQAGEDAPSLVSSIASQVWDAHAHDLSLTVKRDVNTRPHMSHMYAYLPGFRSFIAVFLSNTLCGFFSFWCTLMSLRVNVSLSYSLGHNPNRGESASKHWCHNQPCQFAGHNRELQPP